MDKKTKKWMDDVHLAAKRFIQANSPSKEKTSDAVLAAAKRFLKENKAAPDREVWIGLGGKIVYFPAGTHPREYRPGKKNYLKTLNNPY